MKAKRELILQSVLELFMADGINGLKVSKIASHANIGKGTVYEYFRSKDELFLGAVEYGLSRLAGIVDEKLSEAKGFEESFKALADCIITITRQGPLISSLSDAKGMPFSGETIIKLKDIMQKAQLSFLTTLSEILETGVKEGLIKTKGDMNLQKAMLIIMTNLSVQHAHSGNTDYNELRLFYYDACLKLFS
ncbi:MAG: TetR/AcrR family transcriptional regulator [Clostridia bacterium]|nr:TetR/AcrR family transcriptional regulator [Clostridia bacterium]